MAEAGLSRQNSTGYRQASWLSYRHLFICALFSFTAGLVVASFAGFREFLPGLLEGAWVTIQITVAACVLAAICGLLAGLAKMSSIRPLRWFAIGYIELFRGTSALVQLFWLYYVLPDFGITLPAIPVAILALGLNVGAYGAEVVRGAVMAVPRGQYEAAIALNMTPFTRMRRIILPQALIAMIPPWGNLFIELLKATAIVSLITVSDLTFKAYQLNQATLRTVTIFMLVLVMYLGIALVITFFMRGVERYTRKSLGAG